MTCIRLAVITACLVFCKTTLTAEPSDSDIGQQANNRIEKIRKANATVEVVDADGKPWPNAEVRIEQTRHAFLFGSNIYRWGRIGDPKLQEAYLQQFADVFNYATWGFYWASYEPVRDQPAHPLSERVARWCRERGINLKGHPLAWNYADPRWLPDDPDEVRRLQMARIDDCVGRFRGLIDTWDVVNEAAHFERDTFQRRAPRMTKMWERAGRMEFTRECFRHARAANPKATLLINDYRTDAKYAQVIEQLVDNDGQPLYDVIGIQSHMHGGTWSDDKIWETCQRYARFGVPLHFTEATILSGQLGWRSDGDRRPWPSTPEGERYQAREVERFYTMLFSHPAVEAITWWDFSDNGSWKRAPAGFVRQDMSPKPAYEVLQRLIKQKWWTKTTATAGADGKARFRGFRGEYRITVTVPGKDAVVQELSLNADGAAVRVVVP